jgi:hypothetical protein
VRPNGHAPIDPANVDAIIVNDRDVFVTHTTIKSSVSIDQLIELLRLRKATAEIRILLNQGGKQQVLLTEHTKLSEEERDAVRKVLRMD